MMQAGLAEGQIKASATPKSITLAHASE